MVSLAGLVGLWAVSAGCRLLRPGFPVSSGPPACPVDLKIKLVVSGGLSDMNVRELWKGLDFCRNGNGFYFAWELFYEYFFSAEYCKILHV